MARDTAAIERTRLPVPTFDPLEPVPVIEGAQNDETLTGSLLRPVYEKTPAWWWALFLVASSLTGLLAVALIRTLFHGIGAWGNNIPVAWAYGITNFVWWIGFAHAGTLISAILVLLQQEWRAAINRFAEAMTLCAVIQAGLFPILHLGRPWKFWWLAWYPSDLGLWPNFKSALPWDFAAVTAYLYISFLFWYVGLIPDFGAARDFAPTKRKRFVYGILALGWRGSARHWHHWRTAYLLLAGLATALVVSVESIVSFDFAIAQLPGWHSTVFPPYFVVSAMLSGFALMLVLIIPARRAMGFEHVVTMKHVDLLGKMVVAFSLMTFYGLWQENFFGWYSGDQFESYTQTIRRAGPYTPLFLLEICFIVILPQFLWNQSLRKNTKVAWWISVCVIVGVWIEQFMHIVPSLSRDFLVSSWHDYTPTWVDWSLLFGTVGFFGFLFLLFLRFVPAIPISDVKKLRRDLTMRSLDAFEARGEI